VFRIAVCDDDGVFLKTTADLIERWAQENGLPCEVLTFSDGDGLIAEACTSPVNLVFLDVLMPLFNGIETAKELRQTDKSVRIIFLTSSPEFALDAFSVKAQDYILKPVSYERIKEALDEYAAAVDSEADRLLIKTPFGYRKLLLKDIEYAEAQNKKVVFCLRSGETAEAVETLHVIEERLGPDTRFFKCHRSYLVSLENVDSFNSTDVITKSGRRVPIARGGAKAFKEAYFSMMFRK